MKAMDARRARLALATALAITTACANAPEKHDLDARRERAEAAIRELGLADDPAVAASRAELEAARAREKGAPLIDGVELRAEVSHRRGTSQELTARVPIANPLALPAERAARRHQSEAALARLRSVALRRRADQCLPILDHEVFGEATQIFDRYKSRQRSLLEWNQTLRRAGVVDEIDAARYQLSSELKLDTQAPEPVWSTAPLGDPALGPLVLPQADRDEVAPALIRNREAIREQVAKHQPALDVHRALAERYRALARREAAHRLPSPKFFDLTGETITPGGQSHQYGGQLAFEVPFGMSANAERRRYEALARSERSKERFALEERVTLTEAALGELAEFENRQARWQKLLHLADDAEQLADQWRKDQLSLPSGISNLLDDVYDARRAALSGRERAGLAACRLLASTGVPVADWPRE